MDGASCGSKTAQLTFACARDDGTVASANTFLARNSKTPAGGSCERMQRGCGMRPYVNLLAGHARSDTERQAMSGVSASGCLLSDNGEENSRVHRGFAGFRI